MMMLPQKTVGRILLTLWLLACIGVLTFEFAQRRIADTDIVFAILMIALTFPSGYALGAVISVVFKVLNDDFGIVVPSGFMPNLILWPFFVAVGYFQWFVAFPWLYRKIRTSIGGNNERDAENNLE